VIRSETTEQDQVTELVLAGSAVEGRPVRTAISRRLLIRAIRLGFREIDSPLHGRSHTASAAGDTALFPQRGDHLAFLVPLVTHRHITAGAVRAGQAAVGYECPLLQGRAGELEEPGRSCVSTAAKSVSDSGSSRVVCSRAGTNSRRMISNNASLTGESADAVLMGVSTTKAPVAGQTYLTDC
jgi:hypothetical protein